jgi:hypothetical protein
VADAARWLPADRPSNGDGEVPPADLYKVAVEEYRWQAQYNWSRTQYLLAFNAAILASATAVASQPGRSAALIFALGAATATLSFSVIRTQHDYYRAARDRMRRVEISLRIPADQRTDSSATLGGRKRRASVNQIVYLLLIALALADLVGAVLTLTRS